MIHLCFDKLVNLDMFHAPLLFFASHTDAPLPRPYFPRSSFDHESRVRFRRRRAVQRASINQENVLCRRTARLSTIPLVCPIVETGQGSQSKYGRA